MEAVNKIFIVFALTRPGIELESTVSVEDDQDRFMQSRLHELLCSFQQEALAQ